MNARRRSAPGISLVTVDCGAMTAATQPEASVARALIERRATSNGSVNVIAAATLPYAGQDNRRIAPATITTVTHIANPATTARIDLDIFAPSDDRRPFPAAARALTARCRSSRVESREGRRSGSWKNRPPLTRPAGLASHPRIAPDRVSGGLDRRIRSPTPG